LIDRMRAVSPSFFDICSLTYLGGEQRTFRVWVSFDVWNSQKMSLPVGLCYFTSSVVRVAGGLKSFICVWGITVFLEVDHK
jgi:hypothetical protein